MKKNIIIATLLTFCTINLSFAANTTTNMQVGASLKDPNTQRYMLY